MPISSIKKHPVRIHGKQKRLSAKGANVRLRFTKSSVEPIDAENAHRLITSASLSKNTSDSTDVLVAALNARLGLLSPNHVVFRCIEKPRSPKPHIWASVETLQSLFLRFGFLGILSEKAYPDREEFSKDTIHRFFCNMGKTRLHQKNFKSSQSKVTSYLGQPISNEKLAKVIENMRLVERSLYYLERSDQLGFFGLDATLVTELKARIRGVRLLLNRFINTYEVNGRKSSHKTSQIVTDFVTCLRRIEELVTFYQLKDNLGYGSVDRLKAMYRCLYLVERTEHGILIGNYPDEETPNLSRGYVVFPNLYFWHNFPRMRTPIISFSAHNAHNELLLWNRLYSRVLGFEDLGALWRAHGSFAAGDFREAWLKEPICYRLLVLSPSPEALPVLLLCDGNVKLRYKGQNHGGAAKVPGGRLRSVARKALNQLYGFPHERMVTINYDDDLSPEKIEEVRARFS